MAYNKAEAFGKVLIDLTSDTVTPQTLKQGVTAHNAAGEKIIGSMVVQELDILSTKEELQANTESGKVVDALVVKDINSSLIDSNTTETFNFGSLNGVRGFFTNPSRADDSFIPFKSGVNYVFWDISRFGTSHSYTFSIVPDKVYVMWGTSSGGSVTFYGFSDTKYQWLFGGEGYWGGGFFIAKPSKTIQFPQCNSNKAFALIFW